MTRTNAALAALVAVLGTYAYVVELRGGDRDRLKAEAAGHVFPLAPGLVTDVTLQRPAGTVRLHRSGQAWRIVEPVMAAADDSNLERLLKDLTEARVERVAAEQPVSPAAYGLDHPLLIRMDDGAEPHGLEIGKASPTGEFVFARRTAPGGGGGTGPVLLVDPGVRDAALKPLFDLREKTVLELNQEAVQSIRFTHGGVTVKLVRAPATDQDAQAGWRLAAPVQARADRGAVERSLNLLDYVRAEAFASETPTRLERFGLAPPWGTARFELKGGRSETVLLGGKTVEGALTRFFARKPGGGPVFTLNENLPTDTRRPAAEWREKHLADFTRADVTELRLSAPNRSVVCVKREGPTADDWGLAEFGGPVSEGMDIGAAARSPAAQRADAEKVKDLLSHLTTVEARSFESAGPGDPRFGLQQPVLKVVARDGAGKTLAAISFGNRQGDCLYAYSPHLGSVATLAASELGRYQKGARELTAR